ncbi:putative ferric-chelate reductase 1 [Polypterus senegalus]|uniref:putative ferric-chelate reductase 1 n=1 Tax=Polypterus senegalus TaxID=55291 RepID=UPI001964611D|nr:putative ferric-chelate reductase 1 [Polypterus senegalus]
MRKMQKQCFFVFLFIFEKLVVTILGYSNGAPSSVCSSMLPSHGANPQSSSPPYSLKVDKSTYSPGDQITVTLSGNTYTGFLLEAQQVGGGNAVGSFNIPSNSFSMGLQCNGVPNSAVTHKSSSSKSSLSFTWVSSSSNSLGDIEFRLAYFFMFIFLWILFPVARGMVFVVMISDTTVIILHLLPPSTTTTLQGSSTKNPFTISSSGCGVTKTCFSIPANCDPSTSSSCYFMSSAATQDGIQFEIYGQTDGYVAVGFSDDQQMGSDDIYSCALNNNGGVNVQHVYSIGQSLSSPLSSVNVSTIAASYSGGVMKCSFITKNAISTQQRSSANTYFIFLANGPTSNGNMQFHPSTPFISPSKVDLLGLQVASGSVIQDPLIKAHGALMLIAWMTTGSIGMIIARYFKHVGKGKKIGGKDIWFQVHMFLMIMTVSLTIIAFILAFVSAQSWSGGAHPVLGCIVMGLALIQPFGATFRCAPTDKRRPIFNYLHAVNAVIMKVLAVATIFLGLQLLSSSSPSTQWTVKVMGGFFGWECLIIIILDVNKFLKTKAIYENVSKDRLEPLILIIYILVNLCFMIALLAGIGQT